MPADAPPAARRRTSFVGLLLAAVALAAASLVASLGARWWWALELPAHFQAQYALFLLVASGALLAARRWRWALACAALAAWPIARVAPLWLGSAPAGEPALRVAFLNAFNGHIDRDAAVAWLRAQDADVIVVAELTGPMAASCEALRDAYPHALADPRADGFGLGLYSRLPLLEREMRRYPGAEVPTAFALVRAGDVLVRVVGTHPVPPVGAEWAAWRDGQLRCIADDLRSLERPRIRTLLVGDLNTTSWAPIFAEFCERAGLSDSRAGRGVQATWPAALGPFGITLDHALVGPGLAVTERRVGPNLGSDHRPIVIAVGAP